MKLVILGVTGGIAAYKTAELVRIMVRKGLEVQVVMTEAATRFITPLTLQTLTGRAVLSDMFAALPAERVRHVELAEQTAALVVAPASANTIGKMASGLADNLLTTIYLAARCPVVLVPSMNDRMYGHPAVQDNLKLLSSRGCHIMEPGFGELACGAAGKGRMPEPVDIYRFLKMVLAKKDFSGIRALVTAGPTREALDPVRFLSNPSSGLMGYAIARALRERGAAVFLVSGPTGLNSPEGVEVIPVTSALEMYDAVMACYPQCDLVIKAAAVSDYRPAEQADRKIKKGADRITLQLVANPDILLEIGRNKGDRVLVGFAAETDAVVEHARKKMEAKNLDLIVANDVTAAGCGFASATNQVLLINREGQVHQLPKMDKQALAHLILDHVRSLIKKVPADAE